MRQVFRVRGLDCAHEATLLRGALERIAGVEAIAFDLLRGRMVVTGEVSARVVREAVSTTGLAAEPWGAARETRSILGLATALSGAAMIAAFLSGWAGGATRPFLLVATLAGALPVLPRAFAAARALRPDMHLLMVLAMCGALAIGEWVEAGVVAFLYALSLLLEAWSVGRARRAVEALLDLAPTEATVMDAQAERRCAAGDVAVGSRILVRPGERVPLDAVVLEGESTMDESLLTGESMPVQKGSGDGILAGAINGAGALVARTTHLASETTVAHLVRLVEAAGERRSRNERWVDRFARIYTPAVLALALGAALLPPLLLAMPWSEAAYRALVLLVIACPCALVLATPVSIVAALTAAARRGILVKGGDFLEIPARLQTIAFDKTGTLTLGRPEVVEIVALNDHTEDEVLSRAAAVERRSSHPIAHALLRAAEQRGLALPEATAVRDHGGKGVEGRIGERNYWVGSHRWLDELRSEDARVCDRMEAMAGPGRSVLFVGSERHVCGLVAVRDEPRPAAREQIDALRALGIRRLVLLTGDNRPTAEAIGAHCGLDEVRSELLPHQKVEAIEELLARGGAVAMVGDGVNDAAALARADLGIALGSGASDAALESADIAILDADLSRLPWLVRHSRRTLSIVRVNIAAALVVKAIFVLLTLLGHGSLWAAIAADTGLSLAVVANALRLLSGAASGGRR